MKCKICKNNTNISENHVNTAARVILIVPVSHDRRRADIFITDGSTISGYSKTYESSIFKIWKALRPISRQQFYEKQAGAPLSEESKAFNSV